jgi:hypothetical protein
MPPVGATVTITLLLAISALPGISCCISIATRLLPSEPGAASPESTGAISPAEKLAQQEHAKEKALDGAAASRGEQIVTITDGRRVPVKR